MVDAVVEVEVDEEVEEAVGGVDEDAAEAGDFR